MGLLFFDIASYAANLYIYGQEYLYRVFTKVKLLDQNIYLCVVLIAVVKLPLIGILPVNVLTRNIQGFLLPPASSRVYY